MPGPLLASSQKNQGIATPHYNLDDGNGRARDGVAREEDLDRYTAQAIAALSSGYRAFAGQREDGFYADIQAVFDLLQLRGPNHATTPDDPGFSRLGIFGGDVLTSRIQPGFGNGVIPGGWPNGRRFGDDVVDIAVTALISDLRVSPPVIRGPAGDNVDKNDAVYNKAVPDAGTPHNGRNHVHP